MAKEKKVIYIGQGYFLGGVPARDLTAEEWSKLDKDIQKRAIALGLYEVVAKEMSEDE